MHSFTKIVLLNFIISRTTGSIIVDTGQRNLIMLDMLVDLKL